MRGLIRELRQRDCDRGVALPFVAIMLVLLVGMTAFAVDLGWLYLNGSRVQRGADAAALAGVVHLPADNTEVTNQSVNGANANGWDIGSAVDGSGNETLYPGGTDSLLWQALSENRLEVNVTATVPTFFLKVFGIDELTMTRRATAEYIKPVPMGSPSSCFGIGAFAGNPTTLASEGLGNCTSWVMNYWAAINGPRTAKEHGDPYAVACITANSGGCTGGGPNTDDYRPGGYYYGIEIPAGVTSFNVKIFDAAFYARATPQTETGDFLNLANSNTSAGPTTVYSVWEPDPTPLDPVDNTLDPGLEVCSRTFTANDSTPNTRNLWTSLCGGIPATQGIYILNVRTTGTGGGNNSYSVGVSTNGDNARVYAINDMSVFTNANAGTAFVYLAEVDPSHAGKTLQLGFYDPGENFGPGANASVEVQMPDNSVPTCNWSSFHDNGTPGPSGGPEPCDIQSTINGTPRFNAHWLNASITIPVGYACTTNCFWRMALDMDGAQDRTTWTARVIGNPVRLVPNEP